ncbi:CMP-N-acetylneuraminate-poly-alpha-2,8-sialyltransferase-like [Antedon mediterranea]|uniref:CMP-N-acetylneuraminate-poly-alpha-2, 8-sialyltransferase-like n=1 Tax=Antedon mediterranea TaxID=105859 RepID=UPI003AF7E2EA
MDKDGFNVIYKHYVGLLCLDILMDGIEIPTDVPEENQKTCWSCTKGFSKHSCQTSGDYANPDVGLKKSRFKQKFTFREYIFSLLTSDRSKSMINKSHFNSIDFQRDCAIVGNGGILIGSKCGKNINNHAFVLRSNLAPIVNYEDDVGTKTNMTVLNGQIMDEVIDTVDQGALGKTFLERIQYLNDSILWYSKATEVQFKKHQLQFLSKMLKNKYNLPIRFGYSWRTFDPLTRWFWGTGIRVPHLTTGFNTFTVAVSLCDNITLYGFYPFNHDTNGKPLLYHYYDKTDVLGNHRVHNMPKEYELLTQFNASGVLRLVTNCN